MTSGAELAGLSGLLKRSGGVVECAVTGMSMGDVVPDGAFARVRCDGAARAIAAPRTGDVVALLLGGGLTVHRLVHRGRSRRARGWVVTEGDANLTCDAPVRELQLLGVVEGIRVGGEEWRPPASSKPHAPLRRVASAFVRGSVCIGLEVHPGVARAIKALVVLLMTPLVWLRPYPPGAVRRGSVAHRDR